MSANDIEGSDEGSASVVDFSLDIAHWRGFTPARHITHTGTGE